MELKTEDLFALLADAAGMREPSLAGLVSRVKYQKERTDELAAGKSALDNHLYRLGHRGTDARDLVYVAGVVERLLPTKDEVGD